jgi:hypothetical protein
MHTQECCGVLISAALQQTDALQHLGLRQRQQSSGMSASDRIEERVSGRVSGSSSSRSAAPDC